jgi:flagellar biosynthesis/type III secretory pathway chaperone
MENLLEAIEKLENRIEILVSNYEFLKKENEILLQNVSSLQKKILDQKQSIVNQQKAYDLLKIAKTIEGSSSETKNTKLKLNALIREIDKCIIQLQE